MSAPNLSNVYYECLPPSGQCQGLDRLVALMVGTLVMALAFVALASVPLTGG